MDPINIDKAKPLVSRSTRIFICLYLERGDLPHLSELGLRRCSRLYVN
jgi:hypothetical protein